MVKIRLQRAGAKKRPFYRLIAVDQRRARDGRALEFLGTYDPTPSAERVSLRTERIDSWVARGAQMSDTVRTLVARARASAADKPAGAAPAGS